MHIAFYRLANTNCISKLDFSRHNLDKADQKKGRLAGSPENAALDSEKGNSNFQLYSSMSRIMASNIPLFQTMHQVQNKTGKICPH